MQRLGAELCLPALACPHPTTAIVFNTVRLVKHSLWLIALYHLRCCVVRLHTMPPTLWNCCHAQGTTVLWRLGFVLALLTRHKTCHLHTQYRQGAYTSECFLCVSQDMSSGSCHVMVFLNRYRAQLGCHLCRICSTVLGWERCDKILTCICNEQCMALRTPA